MSLWILLIALQGKVRYSVPQAFFLQWICSNTLGTGQTFPMQLFLVSVIGIVVPMWKEEKSSSYAFDSPSLVHRKNTRSMNKHEYEWREERKEGKEEGKTGGNSYVGRNKEETGTMTGWWMGVLEWKERKVMKTTKNNKMREKLQRERGTEETENDHRSI